jgi:hypothetical protein
MKFSGRGPLADQEEGSPISSALILDFRFAARKWAKFGCVHRRSSRNEFLEDVVKITQRQGA